MPKINDEYVLCNIYKNNEGLFVYEASYAKLHNIKPDTLKSFIRVVAQNGNTRIFAFNTVSGFSIGIKNSSGLTAGFEKITVNEFLEAETPIIY